MFVGAGVLFCAGEKYGMDVVVNSRLSLELQSSLEIQLSSILWSTQASRYTTQDTNTLSRQDAVVMYYFIHNCDYLLLVASPHSVQLSFPSYERQR